MIGRIRRWWASRPPAGPLGQVVQAPSGVWLADYQGWGRRFSSEEAARAYVESGRFEVAS